MSLPAWSRYKSNPDYRPQDARDGHTDGSLVTPANSTSSKRGLSWSRKRQCMSCVRASALLCLPFPLPCTSAVAGLSLFPSLVGRSRPSPQTYDENIVPIPMSAYQRAVASDEVQTVIRIRGCPSVGLWVLFVDDATASTSMLAPAAGPIEPPYHPQSPSRSRPPWLTTICACSADAGAYGRGWTTPTST
uniref:Uncharacterized protein n=1 Tax=Mycena chlorophos TaxID=658473 RepID=A0ABQ0LFC7_MYCCL|nr:predicted protein [Mycena chlorophos]